MKIVIIGSGFGGINAAKELAKNKDFEITIVDKINYHLFQPFLYQVATAGLSPADISVPIRAFFKNNKNVKVLMGEASDVFPARNKVMLSDGKELDYDRLIIAAGAKNHYFNPSWKPHVIGLKSVKEALELRKRILSSFELAEMEEDPERKKALMTFVIIGAGPTGVEMAGSIVELARFSLAQDFRNIDPKDARVILIEAGPRVLSTFSPSLSEKAKEDLEKLGVNVWLKTKVTAIEKGRVELGSDVIGANTIIWAAGVVSAQISNKTAEELNLELKRGNKLPVDKFLKVKGSENVYALGDLAHFDEDPLPGIAPVAIQQGKYIGKQFRRTAKGKEPKEFAYADKGQMATIGRRRAIAEIGKARISGVVAWYMWVFIHIYFLIGFRNRVSVFLQWFWSYITYKKGARIIN